MYYTMYSYKLWKLSVNFCFLLLQIINNIIIIFILFGVSVDFDYVEYHFVKGISFCLEHYRIRPASFICMIVHVIKTVCNIFLLSLF